MNQTFNLLLFLKRTRVKSDGTVPIYLRITIDGKRKDISTHRNVDPDKWDMKTQKVLGNTDDAKSLNAYLKTLERDVYETHHTALKDKTQVTATSLKAKLQGTDVQARMLIPIFQDHNDRIKALLPLEYSPGTLERYTTSLKHTREFLQWKYKISDVDIKEINHAFITDYEFYLRSVRKCANNTAVKYIKNFKKIIKICLANGWLDRNPFVNYKAKLREVERDYLTGEEIQQILEKEFATPRLELVRDIFLFSCYTGLAYIDVKQLSSQNLTRGIDGKKWIFTHRQKTDNASRFYLFRK